MGEHLLNRINFPADLHQLSEEQLPEVCAKLIDLLQTMKSQAIIIVVSHDWDMLEHCNEVIDLDSVQHFKAAL